jgi:hypothetical protein
MMEYVGVGLDYISNLSPSRSPVVVAKTREYHPKREKGLSTSVNGRK